MELQDVLRARRRLEGVIHNIPLAHSQTFSELTGANIYLKCEHQQKTGSFKVRGAYNKISKLSEKENLKAVVASSAGNHAQGVAFSSKTLGIDATIVMPRSTPIAKVSATENYGAKVLLHGDCYDDAYTKALSIQKETNAVFIHPFNDEDVIAGQATIGLEILSELPDADVIIVPVGGGGLLAGVAFAAKSVNPNVKVFGVQAERANAIALSFKKKELISLDNIYTIADGIAVKSPGDFAFSLILQYVDDVVTVSDSDIASTIIHLIERTKQIVEPAGATSLAVAISGKYDIKGKKVVCLLSGGNIDVGFIHKIIEKGLVSRGRQMRFSTLMPDIPGSLARFSAIMANAGANIISVQYDRMSAELHLNEVILHIGCEVSGFEHGQRLIQKLTEEGYQIQGNGGY